MTWKEFKDAVEAQGVKDKDEVWYIDISFSVSGMTVERDQAKDSMDSGWAIWS